MELGEMSWTVHGRPMQKVCFGFGTIVIVCVLVTLHSSVSIRNVKIPRVMTQQILVKSAPRNSSARSRFSHKTLEKRFPDVIIIGVKKGGTRALISMLSSHPKIKAAKSEPQFFSFKFQNGLKWYIEQMPLTEKDELTIEKSPNYFDVSLAPKRLHRLKPKSQKIKLILIVRNPVIRAISDYAQRLAQNINHILSFEKLIFLHNGKINTQVGEVKRSIYDVHFQRWLKWFHRKQILVVNGDELIANPVPVLQQVETFLNVSHYFKDSLFTIDKEKGFFCWKVNPEAKEPKCLGSSKGREHPIVSNSTLNKMKEFLKPHAQNFCQLAAVKFNWCSL